MNSVDLIIILIILIFMLIGSLKGLITTVIGLVEYILSIFLAYKFSPFFANFMIEKWGIDEKINSAINFLIPKIAEGVINSSGEYKEILDTSGHDIESVKQALSNTQLPFLDTIADKIVQIFAIIILFIILKFLFKLISRVLNLIAKLPVLKEFNKIGGMLFGFIEGTIVSIIVVLGISLLPNDRLQDDLDKSFIGNKVSQIVVNITLQNIEKEI